MKLRTAFTRVAFVLTLIAPLFFGLTQAQETHEPHDLLIRNATLMDPGGTSPDRMVSLLG
jgi:hypothetical protein